MSNTIQPWIKTYLIHVAETYGGDLSSVSRETKNKKVQAIEFLTPHVVGKDSWVWVLVSDKYFTIPARLSKEAIQNFETHNLYGGRSLSSYKTGVLHIKGIRPMFTRVPGPNGMKPVPQLALEVDEFGLQGATGEAVYGNPKEVEREELVREWSEGLKTDGGGGNVLKLRKEEREKAAQSGDHEAHSSKDASRKPAPLALVAQKFTAPPSPERNKGPLSRMPKDSNKALMRKAWNRMWRPDVKYSDLYLGTFQRAVPPSAQKQAVNPDNAHSDSNDQDSVLPQTPVKKRRANALDMSTPRSSPEHTEPLAEDAARPTTPSQWTSSPRRSLPHSSPVRMDTDEDANEHSDDGSVEEDINVASSPPSGAESQEDDFDIRSTPHETPEPEEQLSPVAETRSAEEDAQSDHGTEDSERSEADADSPRSPRVSLFSPPDHTRSYSQPLDVSVPEPESPSQSRKPARPSSLPANQASVLSQDQSVADSPTIPRDRRTFTRPFRMPLVSTGRVLVPNSDSSQSQSLSQSQSQSQSLAFSSQAPQVSQDPSLFVPQQSLSYTSQSQSQSQANKDAQVNSQPAEAQPEADAPADAPAEVESLEARALEPETAHEEPVDVDMDDSTNAERLPEAMDIRASPEGSVHDIEDRPHSPEEVDQIQEPRSSPPVEQHDDEENESDVAEVHDTRSSPLAPLHNADSDADNEGSDEDDQLPNSSIEESDDEEDDDNEVLGALQMEDGGESEEEDQLDQEEIGQEEEEESLKPEEEEEEEVFMKPEEEEEGLAVKEEEEEESTPREGSEVIEVEGRDNVEDQKGRREAEAKESDGLSSDDAQTRHKLRKFNGDAKRPSKNTASKTVASPHNVASSSKTPLFYHNVEAWRQPSFLRTRTQAGVPKRRASMSPDGDQPTTKKLRRNSPRVEASSSVHVPKPTASSSRIKSGIASHTAEPLQSTSSKIRRIDLSRSGSTSSTSVKMMPTSQSVKSIGGSNDVGSASKAVKHIDFSSMASTPASRKGKERANPGISSASMPKSKSSVQRVSSSKSTTNAQTGPSSDLATNPILKQQPSSGPRGMLGGHKLDLTMTPDANGPPLVTWTTLTDILLRTGRARHKELEQKGRPGGS